jgi:hypothetical protein
MQSYLPARLFSLRSCATTPSALLILLTKTCRLMKSPRVCLKPTPPHTSSPVLLRASNPTPTPEGTASRKPPPAGSRLSHYSSVSVISTFARLTSPPMASAERFSGLPCRPPRRHHHQYDHHISDEMSSCLTSVVSFADCRGVTKPTHNTGTSVSHPEPSRSKQDQIHSEINFDTNADAQGTQKLFLPVLTLLLAKYPVGGPAGCVPLPGGELALRLARAAAVAVSLLPLLWFM